MAKVVSTLKAEAIATALDIVTGDRPLLIPYADYVEIKLSKKNAEYLTALALSEIRKTRVPGDVRISGIKEILLPLAKELVNFPLLLTLGALGIILLISKR